MDPVGSSNEKGKAAGDLVSLAPPGELMEVMNDIRNMIGNDSLVKNHIVKAAFVYSMDQYIPCKLENCDEQCLITQYARIGDRFYDPRSKQSFVFDALKSEARDFQPYDDYDRNAEPWRQALEKEYENIRNNHYSGIGSFSVYGSTVEGKIKVAACLESHRYSPKNYWNGRWRTVWSMEIDNDICLVHGQLKVQVHYFEDGNVQLVTTKEFEDKIKATTPEETAKALCNLVVEAETKYQTALSENYKTMGETTFKALRRQLPVTRTKIEWEKIVGYKIGAELKNQ
ncbi:DgyrCDS6083 [Dimorphilus gyrociliatus]|uniref:F-actin-capping protein subunit alpha n=1 Tax=Dimorphilus gyrociliatus TaxID=2664684 RepID=A0A7I8VPS9_9ANNE|nr:DgyrCDS6083 [Dimorphilus gyrociliatus]